MYNCAYCSVLACEYGSHENLHGGCPMREGTKLDQILDEYANGEIHDFFTASSAVEAEGYCIWPRLRETVEFCKTMGYKKIGLAFCGGLRKEAKVVADVFRQHGLSVVSVVCKVGGYDKEQAGIPKDLKIHMDKFEPMCNPIAQARLLNYQGTEFNVVVGLCVGHDSLFLKNSDAMATVLIAKDRALGNNPCGAVYTADTYCKGRLMPTAE